MNPTLCLLLCPRERAGSQRGTCRPPFSGVGTMSASHRMCHLLRVTHGRPLRGAGGNPGGTPGVTGGDVWMGLANGSVAASVLRR